MIESIIGILGIAASITMYYIGKKEGKKEKHEDYMIQQIDKIVDTYNDWNRRNWDNGFHAISKLGMCILENYQNIRKAIAKIEITSGRNPFGSQYNKIENVDLFKFFEFIGKNNIDVFKNGIDDILRIIETGLIVEIKR